MQDLPIGSTAELLRGIATQDTQPYLSSIARQLGPVGLQGFNALAILFEDVGRPRQQLLAGCAAACTLAARNAALRDSLSDAGVLQPLIYLTSGTDIDDDELHASCWGALASLVTANTFNALEVKFQGLVEWASQVSSRSGASSACLHAASRLSTALVSNRLCCCTSDQSRAEN